MYSRLKHHPWIREPFNLGHTGSKVSYDQIRAQLFPELAELKQLARDLVSRYIPTKYSQPIPRDISGFELFRAHAGLQDQKFVRRLWKLLPAGDRAYFEHPKSREWLYNERIRVWQGYEIVAHLKATASHDGVQMNPFAVLGLRPWEIIKDKVSLKTPLEDFEVDYYDMVIGQALSRKRNTRTPLGYFLKNQLSGVFGPLEGNKTSKGSLRDQYTKMAPAEQLAYIKRAEKQEKYYEKLGNGWKKLMHPYNQFRIHDTKAASHRSLTESALSWSLLSFEEQQQYGSKEAHLPTSPFYKNQIAQWKTEMVMKYVFDVAGAVGVQEYDWRTDMAERTRGYHYIRGYYQPRVLLSDRKQPVLV